ncbi:MAG: hypothetical protein ACWA5A_16250 [Marinibacterium sp.]
MARFDISATFGLGGGTAAGNLSLVSPLYDIWDFDPGTVTTWDSDVTAATQAELEAAITTAMGQGSNASPQYHRITWTGGPIGGMNLTSNAAVPDKYGPHICVDGGAYTPVNGEIGITNISNVCFTGFQFQRDSSGSGFALDSIDMKGDGGGRRVAFRGNRIGQFWAGGARPTFSRFLTHQSGAKNWEISIAENEVRDLFELASTRPGKLAVKHNFIRGMVDDVVFAKGDGLGGEAYIHLLGNVVCDMHDGFSDNGFHCDFCQCADNNDTAADEYHVLAQGNIYIGDTFNQYPTMAGIIQKQGGANVFKVRYYDNVMLTTGDRGHYQPDQDFQCHRNIYAHPPLGGPIPWDRDVAYPGISGWKSGTPTIHHIRSTRSLGDPAKTSIGVYIAGKAAVNNAGWANLPDPTLVANRQAALGGPTAYDTVFPNMTGLNFQPSPHNSSAKTLMIDNGWAAVPRTVADIRAWVSHVYMPAGGWAANGFNDPAGWFV